MPQLYQFLFPLLCLAHWVPNKYLLTDWIIAANYYMCVQPLFLACGAELKVKHFSKERASAVDLTFIGGKKSSGSVLCAWHLPKYL